MPAQFEVRKSVAGKYFWRFKGANGETVCFSEEYESKQGCLDGIASVKNNAANAPIDDPY